MNRPTRKGLGGTDITHSQESLSLAYMQTLLAATGLNHSTPVIDNDGIDLIIRGKDFNGYFKEPKIDVQLKCISQADCIDYINNELIYPLKKNNYNYLIGPSPIPLLLVVHFAPESFCDWLSEDDKGTTIKYASYWYSLYGEAPIEKSSKTIRIPLKQRFNSEVLVEMMQRVSNAEIIHNMERGAS